MKKLLLLPIIFLSACSSTHQHPSVLRAKPVGRLVSSNGLRSDDQLREYRLGRYVDGHDPLVMHEGHPVYRVETSAHWDLRLNDKSSLPRRDIVQSSSVSTNDAVVAEVNKQRAATQAFTEQTTALNQKLTELSHAIGQTEEIAKQNLSLKKDVADLREHLDALDAQLNQPKPTVSAQPSPEDKW
jgi:hypothetical protein